MECREVIIRLSMAAVLGGIIGYERERKNRTAGFRTHILLCIGACIISLTQIKMAENAFQIVFENEVLSNVVKVDYGRLGAQVISGVGFIGAGAIIHTKGTIRGLTTATTLWIVACIGLAVGMGYYEIATCAGVLIVIVLSVLKILEKKFFTRKIKVITSDKEQCIDRIEELFNERKIKIKSVEFLQENIIIAISTSINIDMNKVILSMYKNKYVQEVIEL